MGELALSEMKVLLSGELPVGAGHTEPCPPQAGVTATLGQAGEERGHRRGEISGGHMFKWLAYCLIT